MCSSSGGIRPFPAWPSCSRPWDSIFWGAGRAEMPAPKTRAAVSVARPPEGAHTAAEGEGTPSFVARPPEGAHTVAEGEGTPSFAARPPEGAHTAAEGGGAPVNANHRTPVLDIRALTVEFPVYQGAVR